MHWTATTWTSWSPLRGSLASPWRRSCPPESPIKFVYFIEKELASTIAESTRGAPVEVGLALAAKASLVSLSCSKRPRSLPICRPGSRPSVASCGSGPQAHCGGAAAGAGLAMETRRLSRPEPQNLPSRKTSRNNIGKAPPGVWLGSPDRLTCAPARLPLLRRARHSPDRAGWDAVVSVRT